MNRREFLSRSAIGLWGANRRARLSTPPRSDAKTNVLVVGGGLGGCAAALAAAAAGCSVILTEETDWWGGQASVQGTPPDEHPWIEDFGCTRRYRAYRDAVRAYYRAHYPLTEAARGDPQLNPGNGWVSRLCHEPAVSAAVLSETLAAAARSGRLELWPRMRPHVAVTNGDRLEAVGFEALDHGGRIGVEADLFIDATELGDLLPLAGVEHVVGAESGRETGEAHASAISNPLNQQAINWCFALEHRPGESHVIERPAGYERWRDQPPPVRPPWGGPLLRWEHPSPVTLRPRILGFDPTPGAGGLNLWTYRRALDAGQLIPGADRRDVTVVNWPQNDYWLGPLCGVPKTHHDQHLAAARSLSRCLLHWMQTEAPRPDGGAGWPGLAPSGPAMGTADGFAKAPYIRESRRIRALFTVVEEHVAAVERSRTLRVRFEQARGEPYADAVGIGAYRLDLHPTTGGENYLDIPSAPFQIPLGALIPRRLENLLAGGKNLGVTHITNGCYRVHPVEWNVGEAAGALAAFCLGAATMPPAVRQNRKLLADFQARLRKDGFELEWPALAHPL